MDTPYLIPLYQSADSKSVLVIINGYKTGKHIDPTRYSLYIQSIQSLGWAGDIELLWWDASSPKSLLYRTLAPFHWHKVKHRAERTGKNYFASMLQHTKGRDVSIIAHSLGARVAYYGISEFKPANARIQDVILLGGAIRRNKRGWVDVGKNITGKLINVYNQNDKILRRLYRIAELRTNNPIGLGPININQPNIINIDAAQSIKQGNYNSHKGYWKCLHLVPPFSASIIEGREGRISFQCD